MSVVNVNLIIMFKHKHILFPRGAIFFSIVGCIASGTMLFYFFSVNAITGVIILV